MRESAGRKPDSKLKTLNAPFILPVDERLPWHRYWAKIFDLGAVFLPVLLVIYKYSSFDPMQSKFGYVMLPIFLLYESTCIHFFGTTIGKKAMSIHVTDIQGAQLEWVTSLKRSVIYFITGEALFIPILSSIVNYIAYRRLLKDGTTIWDVSVGSRVQHSPIQPGLLWPIVAIEAAIVMRIALIVLPRMMNDFMEQMANAPF